MEATPLPRLIWLDEPVTNCLESGEILYGVEADLVLQGPERVAWRIELGHAQESGRWYGFLDDLMGLVAEEGWSIGDVTGFGIGREKQVEAGIHYTGSGRTVSWETFVQRARQEARRQATPTPSASEVRALPVLPEEWELAFEPAFWITPKDAPPSVVYAILVVDARDRVRQTEMTQTQEPDAATLARAVFRATLPDTVSNIGAGRPRILRVHDARTADALEPLLADTGIPVSPGSTPHVDTALRFLSESVGRASAAPYFVSHAPGEVKAFFRAARSFLKATPWKRLRGDRYLAFRVGEGPWQYVNVMGQMGEHLGLTVFDSWLQVCRFVHNAPRMFDFATDPTGVPKRLQAVGAVEGVSLSVPQSLHPKDAVYLQSLGLKSMNRGKYPAVERFTPEGPALPSRTLSEYTVLMDAIAQAVQKRRAATITSINESTTAFGAPLVLRYPAQGNEHLAGVVYRLRIRADGNPLPQEPNAFSLIGMGASGRLIEEGEALSIEAPASLTVAALLRRLDQEWPAGRLWRTGVGQSRFHLWSNLERGKPPSPYVADLEGLEDLWLDLNDVHYPMEVSTVLGAAGDETHVSVGS